MTTRQKQRQAEFESRMKMWGIAPTVESIHDDECGLIEDRIALAEYADWKSYGNPDTVLLSKGDPVAVKPYFSVVNVLSIACAVMVAGALVALIVVGRVP